MSEAWPPDYTAVFRERQKRYDKMLADPQLVVGAKEYYKDHILDFINDWCVTYDPRNAGTDTPITMPFCTFPRQDLLVDFIIECYRDKESGLVEKCRTAGASWIACGVATGLWLFNDGVSVGFGTNKAEKLDKLGDPDSIFEKIRILINSLPRFFWPDGFDPQKHALLKKIINPENGSTITGEAGDNVGRGGRKSIYFCDESAHWDRPEKKEAALSETTDVRIDLSSVYGTATVFDRRRKAGEIWEPGKKIKSGVTRVFIFDWRDHPHMTQEWYDKKKKKAEREGLTHIFAQEVDRDASAAIENVLIPQQWVKAAIDAHKVLGFDDEGVTMAALDVADEGGDKNAFACRKGVVLKCAKQWGQGDVGETTRKAVTLLKLMRTQQLQYDCIGIGAGVKSEYNRLKKETDTVKNIVFVPWSASARPLFPNRRILVRDKESPLIKDFFGNLKAQAWWELRWRFERTFRAVTKGTSYDTADLISISSDVDNRFQLEQELSQPTYAVNGKGQIIVNKKPDGATSPNIADAVVMCYWPVQHKKVII